MKLMDTSICIDILRGYPLALLWHAALIEPIGIPGFVGIELIMGCRNSLELANHQKFMQVFPIIWPATADLDRTLIAYAPLKLSHGIGGFDALIAATVVGGGHTLLTRNTKHFQPIPGILLEMPYS